MFEIQVEDTNGWRPLMEGYPIQRPKRLADRALALLFVDRMNARGARLRVIAV